MKYFTFTEFERSEKATQYAILNRIPDALKANVAALVDNVLDPLREAWGGPIDVSSGYRCPQLNKVVGGAVASQHMKGEAADIWIFTRDSQGNIVKNADGKAIVDRTANRRIFQMIQELGLPFDQLIDEHDFAWVHVSHRAQGPNRGEIKKL